MSGSEKGPDVLSSESNVNSGQGPRLSPSRLNVSSGRTSKALSSGLNVSQLVCRCCLLEVLLVRLTRVAILGSDHILIGMRMDVSMGPIGHVHFSITI